MARNILISGATGLIGPALIRSLEAQGNTIAVLTRDPTRIVGNIAFKWDVSKNMIDLSCMEGIDTVIHLAGAAVAGPRWTAKRKKEIIDSRVCSTELLHKAIAHSGTTVTTFISASAVGYYGDRGEELLTETAPKGTGFLSDCCDVWEKSVKEGSGRMRTVIVRVGIVLAKNGGSLPVMALPVKLFAGTYLGSGNQWIPWIHLGDLVSIFTNAVNDRDMHGVYNGSAPFPVTNKDFTKALATALTRPVWPFGLPKAFLKLLLGEQHVLPLMSTKASPKKLLNRNFKFRHERIEDALSDIYIK